jgi:hypothetical protein
MSEQALNLTFTSPDATTDAQSMVRICEVSIDTGGAAYTAVYRFDLKTGDLRISVLDQLATINTTPVFQRLIEAAGGQHAQAH